MKIQEEADRIVIQIQDELTIQRAGRLKAELGSAHFTKPVTLDLTEITEMDSAGLQLVLSLEAELRSRNLKLTVLPSNTSKSISAICEIPWT